MIRVAMLMRRDRVRRKNLTRVKEFSKGVLYNNKRTHTMVNERIPILARDDQTIFDNARAAGLALKQTFDAWVTIGRAVVRAKEIAGTYVGKTGSGKVFRNIIVEQELGDIVSQATASHLLQIMARLTEVTAWHETLPAMQRIKYAAPTTILKHCPIFKKPKTTKEKDFKPANLDHAIESLQHHLDQMDDDGKSAVIEKIAGKRVGDDGDIYFSRADTASDIAKAIFSNFKPSKVENIARTLLKMLKERTEDKADLSSDSAA